MDQREHPCPISKLHHSDHMARQLEPKFGSRFRTDSDQPYNFKRVDFNFNAHDPDALCVHG